MNEKRIKVVWVSHFSDTQLREHLHFDRFYYRLLLYRLNRKRLLVNHDYAPWIRNGINQFEQFNDIDLTVIHPHYGVSRGIQRFTSNGVKYVCFRSEDDNWFSYVLASLIKGYHSNYHRNSHIIVEEIKTIHPDIVHFIGAENPDYSLSALDVPSSILCLVSLQTLMSAPGYCDNYPINKDLYVFRSKVETDVIKRCDYIASDIKSFQQEITKRIKPDARFVELPLAVGVDIDLSCEEKLYDFVYFAGNISKAGDDAVEAFAIACKKHPNIVLNLSGDYTSEYKAALDERIRELGIERNVIYSGSKASHEEVLLQIKKSRFALIPLKVDYISGTIREAMACGLPVVTTITQGTPKLNESRESVLLSEIGDYHSMAENICRLVENGELANMLRENALITIKDLYGNEAFMSKWREAYYSILENCNNGKQMPDDF